MRALPARFIADESGQGLVEYAMIVALVATALIAILVLFRNSVGNVFNSSTNELDAAQLNGY